MTGRRIGLCVAYLSMGCSTAVEPPAGSSGITNQGGSASSGGTSAGAEGGASAVAGSGGLSASGGAPATAGTTNAGGVSSAGGAAGSGLGGGSPNAGSGGDGGAAGAGPIGFVPGLVAVGYGGMRVVSRDGGLSWSDYSSMADNGGDDDNLLRAVVYGKGKWLATGWKLLTSDDGVVWTELGKLNELPGMPDCGIIEALAFDGTYFYAGCTPWQSPGHLWRSADGSSWTDHGDIGDTEGHLFLTFRAGKFVAYGDTLTTFGSADAVTWEIMSGIERGTLCEGSWKSESDCHDASWFDGIYLRGAWPNVIESSANGSNWATAFTDPHGNGLYQSRAIAAGYVAP